MYRFFSVKQEPQLLHVTLMMVVVEDQEAIKVCSHDVALICLSLNSISFLGDWTLSAQTSKIAFLVGQNPRWLSCSNCFLHIPCKPFINGHPDAQIFSHAQHYFMVSFEALEHLTSGLLVIQHTQWNDSNLRLLLSMLERFTDHWGCFLGGTVKCFMVGVAFWND